MNGEPGRIFIHEPGWQVVRKVGSTREFCYMMAPGQDYYHRLLDGELYLVLGDERICFACAERRGLLSREAKSLREPMVPVDLLDIDPAALEEFDVVPRDDDE